MAKADRKHFGAGVAGKGDGAGAMREVATEDLPANAVLSNRDKSRHSQERGLDGKAVMTEQREDHAANRRVGTADGDGVAPEEQGR